MKNENFIIINGQKYDSVTGKPITPQIQKKPAQLIDSISKKSHTIYQHAVKRPVQVTMNRKPGRNLDIARSGSVSKFKPRNTQNVQENKENPAPTKHPIVLMGEKRQALIRNHLSIQKQNNTAIKTPQAIKQEAIEKALEQPTRKTKEKPFFVRHAKLIIIATFILIAGGATYFTYSSMPGFSVKIASAQAGINATFPGYYPDGYSPNGPVTSNNSQVLINFKSNTDTSFFNIRQTRSSWDSTAVKEMVIKKSNNTFSTTEERGLTIYVYNGNAAWVNGGILYEIVGNAPLSSYQVRKMATSL